MEQQKNQSTENEKKQGTADNKTIMAVIAYILFFVPLLTEDKKDPFVRYHVRQGLALFALAVVVYLLNGMIYNIFPLSMWYFARLISWLLNIAVLVLFILGVKNALSHKEEPLPLIGKIAEKFKI
ncbi:MAG TPA: hypothetical protein PLQ44_02310 [Candidatus Paceibacterota bacterium]|nr:hypothetical protein [Candidatus Paceibacterota bacterium]HPT40412.1 hypothetical protein [Candidatus Paceibacterota bacterium]